MSYLTKPAALEILEEVEDWLESKGVEIANPDKEDDPDASLIYGEDFDELMGLIENRLVLILEEAGVPEEILVRDKWELDPEDKERGN